MAKQKKHPTGTIAQNKKARHDYFIEHKFEAGLVLSGWEVKSLRAGKAHLVDSYVLLKDGEAWLFGSHITPLTTASTHVIADPIRTRKLLLNKRELERLKRIAKAEGVYEYQRFRDEIAKLEVDVVPIPVDSSGRLGRAVRPFGVGAGGRSAAIG